MVQVSDDFPFTYSDGCNLERLWAVWARVYCCESGARGHRDSSDGHEGIESERPHGVEELEY
jgi:hypothetical protein